jgi:malic enzyme
MRTTPSPGYSITLRLEIINQVGIFGKIGTAIGEVGGDIGAVDIVKVGKGVIVRDITIVFTLANPEPEIAPEDASPYVRILATGRSDYPNQINNMLCFPGLFRELLDSRAKTVNEGTKLSAAKAIASMVDEIELSEDYIVPSIFDRKVVTAVASAISEAAFKTGAARRERWH